MVSEGPLTLKLNSDVVLLNANDVTVEFDETDKRLFPDSCITAKLTISDDAPKVLASPS